MRDSFRIRRTALLLVGAASLPELFDAILTEYNLACRFFHLEHAGQVLVRGVKEKEMSGQGMPCSRLMTWVHPSLNLH